MSADDDWQSIFDDFASQIHEGELSGKQIHNGLYFKTAKKLSDAITKGFPQGIEYNDPRNALVQRLKANLYQFSGAKSLTELAAFNQLLLDDTGEVKPFNIFKRDVRDLHGLYNERYLLAEYEHALASAQMAELWSSYNDDDWLEYRTAGDERVRDSHAKLDGIVQQKTSTFWKTNFPPLGWGCRCTVVPAPAPKEPMSAADAGKQAKGAVESKIFENNAGESGIVFKEDHPYFESFGRASKLDSVRNYGLRPVDSILRQEDLPARLHMDTETDYYAWWSSMIKKHGVNATDFALTDKLGIKVLFDAAPTDKKRADYFKDHIIRKTAEARHEYAANIEAIMRSPDEIWMDENDINYIKYFNDGMYIITAVNDGESVTAVTMYRVDDTFTQKKKRKGVLLYKQ